MKLVLSHETALSHLRAHRERRRDRIVPSRIRTLDDCACSLHQIETFSLPFLVDNEHTLHVLVSSLAKEQKSKTHTCHVLTGSIPSGAFWKIGDSVYAARNNVNGIIHLLPFSCMPEIVSQNILPKVSKEENIPVLSLVLDEQTGHAGYITRIEAFVDLIKRKMRRQDDN